MRNRQDSRAHKQQDTQVIDSNLIKTPVGQHQHLHFIFVSRVVDRTLLLFIMRPESCASIPENSF